MEREKLFKLLNSYFGTEFDSMLDFKRYFKSEYLSHAQTENLLNFLLFLERKSDE